MKKLLVPVISVVLLFASLVWGAITVTQSPAGKIILTKYFSVSEVVDFDSLAGATALTDTSTSFSLWPFGQDRPFADAVAFEFGVTSYLTEVTTNVKVDTLVVRLDGCTIWYTTAGDSTQIVERSLAWHPIAFNDNSDADTVALGDGNDVGNKTYWATGQLTLSAAELAAAAGCTNARFVFTSTGDGAAGDTVHVAVKMIQSYTGWITQ